MRCLAVCLLSVFLIGCTGTAQVATPVVTHNSLKVAGNYAVHMQAGGWQLKTKPSDMACMFWSFDTPVDQSYVTAMQTVLKETLQNVDFRSDIQNVHTLRSNGYDAQISLVQGPADSRFGSRPGLFISKPESDVALTLHIAILYPDGQRQQQSVTGKARESAYEPTCGSISNVVADAAREAVRDVVLQAIDSIDDRLEIKRLQASARGG